MNNYHAVQYSTQSGAQVCQKLLDLVKGLKDKAKLCNIPLFGLPISVALSITAEPSTRILRRGTSPFAPGCGRGKEYEKVVLHAK